MFHSRVVLINFLFYFSQLSFHLCGSEKSGKSLLPPYAYQARHPTLFIVTLIQQKAHHQYDHHHVLRAIQSHGARVCH